MTPITNLLSVPFSSLFDHEDYAEASDAKDSNRAINLAGENVDLVKDFSSMKILSYNVWFREDLELHKRMRLLPIYMTFSSSPPGGMDIIAQFLLRRLIQNPTFVCWFGDKADEREQDVVTQDDLERLYLLEGKDGLMDWQSFTKRSTPNMQYKAWCHESEFY